MTTDLKFRAIVRKQPFFDKTFGKIVNKDLGALVGKEVMVKIRVIKE